jgi:hypothetical protein
MAYSNRRSKRGVPGVRPDQQPFSPNAVVEARRKRAEKARKANRSGK